MDALSPDAKSREALSPDAKSTQAKSLDIESPDTTISNACTISSDEMSVNAKPSHRKSPGANSPGANSADAKLPDAKLPESKSPDAVIPAAEKENVPEICKNVSFLSKDEVTSIPFESWRKNVWRPKGIKGGGRRSSEARMDVFEIE